MTETFVGDFFSCCQYRDTGGRESVSGVNYITIEGLFILPCDIIVGNDD